MVEGNEVGRDDPSAKPSPQTEVVVLRREIERVLEELRAQREAQAVETAHGRSRALEAVGRLAGGIAHDFDNLVGPLVESLDAARRATAPGAPAEPHLERASSIARDAGRITKQLLTFAGQSVGQADSGTEVVDLAQETERSLAVLRRLVDAEVALTVHVPSEPVWVVLERGHLTQILLNLLVNARDAMPTGGTLTIEVRPSARAATPNGELRPGGSLRVEDSGVGIAPADLPRIFDPFFTTKLPGRGAGLGLSTVFGMVNGVGGDVSVESEQRRGTTFDLWFRAGPAPAASPKRKSSQRITPLALGAPLAPAIPKRTILVVEDNASLAETCVAIFEGAGYRVMLAADGAEALEIVEREREISTVLSDVVMPRVSGIELARKLAVSHPEIRVVLWSGYPQELSIEALQRGARSNVATVLPKPVEADTLLDAVSRTFERD